MNKEEIDALIKELKAQGMKEEEILEALFEGFKKGEYSREDLGALANAMGYELSEDFKNDKTPDPITEKGEEGVTKEEIEDLKEFDPKEESEEEYEEKTEEAKEELDDEEEESEDEEEEESESEDEDEDEEESEEEWDEAKKYFKV